MMEPTSYPLELFGNKSPRGSFVPLHSEPNLPLPAATAYHYPVSPIISYLPLSNAPPEIPVLQVRTQSHQVILARCVINTVSVTVIGVAWSMACATIGSLVLTDRKQSPGYGDSPTYGEVTDSALFGTSAAGGAIIAAVICALFHWVGLKAEVAPLRTSEREASMTAEESERSEKIQNLLEYCSPLGAVVVGAFGQALGVILLRSVLSGGYTLGAAITTSAMGELVIIAVVVAAIVLVCISKYSWYD
ncbi:hypothetical protein WOLCODRAFT_146904 [Wolfiporia cocos MD-104 SS10]|uniref:Uncharacterized protein n=1 Tax=Wolfiporia cocos (strain MD-104) TaxID=742152 RepID=A0A2H3JAW8_WOLCO|nr:hypothetical protein WOLCODRAFT_146904 [Wolfiporia cocos MD-104 SS10]